MAQKVQVVLVDDVDGGTAEETVSFSLDGVSYEIDLSAKNAAKLREEFAPWVGTARRAGGRARRGTRRAASRGGSSADVRAWAKERGLAVNERGRIPAGIVAQYEAAH